MISANTGALIDVLPSTLKPYYDRAGFTIYHASCWDVLPMLLAASVDLVLTDPPYGVSGRQDEAAIVVADHAPFRRHFGEWDLAWNPAKLLSETERLLRPGGALFAFLADEWINAYADTPLTVKKLGAWLKTNPPPRVRPGYRSTTELWTWQVKTGATPTWNGGFTQSNVFTMPNAASCEGPLVHPTQKPLRLISRVVQLHSNAGDLIVDPFMGSGTTLRAAKDLGRRAIGIEIDESYCEIAAKRLRQEALL